MSTNDSDSDIETLTPDEYIARLQEFERGPAGDGLDMLEEIDAVWYSLSHHRDPVGFDYNSETATEGYLDALGRFIRDTGLKWAPHDDETATTDRGLSESSATGANKRNESTPSQDASVEPTTVASRSRAMPHIRKVVEVDLSPSRQQAPKKKKVTIRSKGKAKVAEYDSDVTESDTETEIDTDKTESDTDAEEIGPATVSSAKKAATSRSKKTKNIGAAAKVSTKAKGKKKVVAASDDEDDSMGEQDDEKEVAPASQDDD
ncbi:hypothetical protein C8R44DRAFT_742512 [Mycena epipterygia]|nr:hypothetical protein C8R44DRAFT_742512 [Mycena epipterygia]